MCGDGVGGNNDDLAAGTTAVVVADGTDDNSATLSPTTAVLGRRGELWIVVIVSSYLMLTRNGVATGAQ